MHVSSVRRFLAVKLPREEIDDALSITFLRLWNYVTGTKVDHISGLIFTIARGVIAEYYRRRPVEGDHYTGTISLDDVDTDSSLFADRGEEQIFHSIDMGLLRDVMASLDDEMNLVLLLRYFEDLPIKEIAKRLQKSEGTTRVFLHRSLNALKKKLERLSTVSAEKHPL